MTAQTNIITNQRPAGQRLARLAAFLLLPAAALAQPYTVKDLGTLGGPGSFGFALNNLGRAAGASFDADADLHGFYWDGGLREIAPLPEDTQAQAFAVNDNAQALAVSFDLGELKGHGLIWQDGIVTELGDIAPRGINAAGAVAGYITLPWNPIPWVDHAARWDENGIHDLGTLGGSFSTAAAISDAGRLVGWSTSAGDQNVRATLWQNDVARDLGTLGGTQSQAYDINENGQVVGYAETGAGKAHAFMFTLDPNGNVIQRRDLGELGGDYSYAYAVSAAGHVVGVSNAHAFIWKDGVMTDLNDLLPPQSGWRLDAAWSISDAGAIAGTGVHLGFPRAFLLTPAGGINCDLVKKVTARCTRSKIKASVKTGLPEGTQLTLLLDGTDPKVVELNRKGKAKTSWRDAAPGAHEVCIEECPAECAGADCGP